MDNSITDKKIAQLEQELEMVLIENKMLKNTIKRFRECEDIWKQEHEKYSTTMEQMRARIRESNNRLENFSQLFRRLSKDMSYLNETKDLVMFAEDSKQFLQDTMNCLPYSPTLHTTTHGSPMQYEYANLEKAEVWDDE